MTILSYVLTEIGGIALGYMVGIRKRSYLDRYRGGLRS